MEHFKVACEPFYFEKVDPLTGNVEIKMKQLDMIDEDKSLLNLVLAYVKQSPKHIQEKDAREALEAKREARMHKQQELYAEKQAKLAEAMLAGTIDGDKVPGQQEILLMKQESLEEFCMPLTKEKDGDFDVNDEIQTM